MIEVVSKAQSLIGTPFRLQGRSPEIALDCVGLIIEAFGLPAEAFPYSYGWRGHSLVQIDGLLHRHFRRVSRPSKRAGDVLVLKCAKSRYHFGIVADSGLIHADAVSGQVVCRPWPLELPIVRVCRRRKRRI